MQYAVLRLQNVLMIIILLLLLHISYLRQNKNKRKKITIHLLDIFCRFRSEIGSDFYFTERERKGTNRRE